MSNAETLRHERLIGESNYLLASPAAIWLSLGEVIYMRRLCILSIPIYRKPFMVNEIGKLRSLVGE